MARLANEKISWLDEDDRRRLLDIADRLRRWLDDLDAGVARTAVLADEINNLMAEATNRRAYQMSVMALLFLPASFLTGLFGINLGGIRGPRVRPRSGSSADPWWRWPAGWPSGSSTGAGGREA